MSLSIYPEHYSNFEDQQETGKKTYILPIPSGGSIEITAAQEKGTMKQGLYSVVYPLDDNRVAKLSHLGVTDMAGGSIEIDGPELGDRLQEVSESSDKSAADLARRKAWVKMLEVANHKQDIHEYLEHYVHGFLLDRDLMTIVDSPRKALDKILQSFPEGAYIDKRVPDHEISVLEIVEKIRFSFSDLPFEGLQVAYERPSIKPQLKQFSTGALHSILQGGQMLDISDSNGVRLVFKDGSDPVDTTNIETLLGVLTGEITDIMPVPKNVGVTKDKQNPRLVLYDEDPLHEIINTPMHGFAHEIANLIRNQDYQGIKDMFDADEIVERPTKSNETGRVISKKPDDRLLQAKLAITNHLLLLKYLGADFDEDYTFDATTTHLLRSRKPTHV